MNKYADHIAKNLTKTKNNDFVHKKSCLRFYIIMYQAMQFFPLHNFMTHFGLQVCKRPNKTLGFFSGSAKMK